MAYLSGADNAFEKAIARGKTSFRSSQLNDTVASVKQYVKTATPENLRTLYWNYDSWKTANPLEFQDRGRPIQADFERELRAEYLKQGLGQNFHFEDDDADEVMPHAPHVAINRWSTFKRGAKLGLTGASVGMSAAQQATGTGLGALAMGSAAAVSATGIGLVAAGGALAVTQSVLAAKSAWKTRKHKNALVMLYDQRNASPYGDIESCQMVAGDGPRALKTRQATVQHDMISNLVLPYVISKKTSKMYHKMATAVPIVGSGAETARAIGKKAWKFANGTLGVHRQNAAAWLASHLITCDCMLVQAIVAELYSDGEMEWLKEQPYGTVIEYLEPKLKST